MSSKRTLLMHPASNWSHRNAMAFVGTLCIRTITNTLDNTRCNRAAHHRHLPHAGQRPSLAAPTPHQNTHAQQPRPMSLSLPPPLYAGACKWRPQALPVWRGQGTGMPQLRRRQPVEPFLSVQIPWAALQPQVLHKHARVHIIHMLLAYRDVQHLISTYIDRNWTQLLTLTPCDMWPFLAGRTLWVLGDRLVLVPHHHMLNHGSQSSARPVQGAQVLFL